MLGAPDTVPGLTPGVLSLRDELAAGQMPVIHTQPLGFTSLTLCHGSDTIWCIIRDENGGGFALRTVHTPGMPFRILSCDVEATGISLTGESPLGTSEMRLTVPDRKNALLRCTVTLIPSENLLLPFLPRDLYPIDEKGNPAATKGRVFAAQRGVNGGLMYLSLQKPTVGSLLYFQNLTALNDYFRATDTQPDGVVGGQWPELGYQPATAPNAPSPPENPLPKGKKVTLSDAFLNLSPQIPETTQESARLFVDLLAMVYSRIDRPETQYHDWLDKAKATLRDLNRSSKVTLSHYSHRYVRPYTNAEYPDSMVQLTVLTPISEYASWSDAPPEAVAFSEELSEGLSRFYDKDLKTMRRYLPNVGEDKDKDEVDSWYLYHPLINLGRLAKAGNTKARKLFFDSLEYGIATAHHFQYQWPIQYNVTTREVVKAERKDGEPGQSDVGGIYAYLMLQAWDLSEDSHYLDEARNALRAASDMEFSMLYQTNLTAWGANASLRLWRITQDEAFRDQSFVFIANYCHNCVLWESQIKAAEHHPVFMGATCLHDGPYLAIYECFESFMAFEEFLALGQDDLPDSVQLLLAEYYKYTLHRAWYFYPSELPEDILAKEIRNGEIDRSLAFPLEDLYASGQAPGSVGQEVYGCGAAFTFVTRAYHQPQGASFLIFAEYPTKTWEQPESSKLIFRTRGVKGYDCKIRIIPVGRAVLPTIYLYETDSTTEPNRLLRGRVTEEGHCEFIVSADNSFLLTWE